MFCSCQSIYKSREKNKFATGGPKMFVLEQNVHKHSLEMYDQKHMYQGYALNIKALLNYSTNVFIC
jgi:hypothetical protein